MKRNCVALTLLLLLTAAPLSANDDPVSAKGFVAGQVYQFGDIAHVNLFNGNLNIVLPLGQQYKVNGALSYAITLSYSGNNWVPDSYQGAPVEICNPDCHQIQPEYDFFRPTVRSNAGLGWLASVGGLIATLFEDDPPPAGGTSYRSPDSADHPLSNTNPDSGPGYTSDGVFLRVTNVDGGTDYRDLEFPDGTIKRFQHSDGRLVSIRDRFGNQVTIDYSAAADGAPIWSIHEGTRTHTVTFEKLTVSQGPHDAEFYYVVKEIDLAAFGGAQAQYKFHYNPDGSGTDRATLISRRLCVCPANGPGSDISGAVLVPLLTELTLPDGTSYKMSYNFGDAANVALEKDTGNLIELTLPTLGKYQWDYQEYTFPDTLGNSGPPGGIINPPDNMNIVAGLSEQRLLDAGGNKLSVTKYGTRLLNPTGAEILENSVSILSDPQTNAVASKTLNYFDAGNAEGMTKQAQPDPGTTNDIVNPRTAGGVERYLSSKTYDASNHLARATFVVYDDQYRVGSQEVVTYDNTASSPRELNSARTDYSDFDGYGHYRSVRTSGNFADQNAYRTVTTAYNKADTDVGGSIFDTGTFDPINGATPWPVGTPWILNMYSSVAVTDGSATQKSLACFDTTTGFLTRTRSMIGTGPAAHDIIARFTPDAGNVGKEEYFGGDDGTAPVDVGAVPVTALCDITSDLGTSTYPRKFFTSHHYTAGSLDKTSYLDPSCSSSCTSILDTVDRTIDSGTGLPSASRDPSGLATTFVYDSSGRISSMTPPSDLAGTTYTYTAASGSGTSYVNPTVKVETTLGTNGLTSVYTYDALGRLILESITGAGTPRYRTTSYDALGRKKSVSTLDTATSPSYGTSYIYDVLDRPLTVTEPDGSVTSFDYVSEASTTTRTVTIHTASGDTAAPTKELHDRQNRVASVVEPNGTVTSYTYDLADHLTSVTTPGEGTIQHRYFNYDGRGFLQSEQHPELGHDGNGETDYGEYDARGHARRKRTGSVGGTYDLSFAYDSVERLTSVKDVGHSHLLKTFTFADANGTGTPIDYRKGKLFTATRSNPMPTAVSGDVVVTETYKYENTTGKPSERDTLVKNGTNTIQSFKQSFTYDGLGAVTAPGYPTCLSPVSCSAIPSYTTATNVYTNGLLTKVQGFGDQTYNNNGTLGSVAHANGVTDTITEDDHQMPRPKSIGYGPWTSCTAPSAPSITTASSICANSTNNAASIAGPDPNLTYTWSISPPDAQLSDTTGTAVTYSPGSGTSVTLSVTATASCGSAATTSTTVTVASPTASVSGGGSGTVQIQATLTGTPPWAIVWSDNYPQPNPTSSPVSRSATPSATPYTITSIQDVNGCAGTSSGSAIVAPLPPTNVNARTQDNSLTVSVTWGSSSGATSYRIERATCMSPVCWGAIGSTTNTSYLDTVPTPAPTQPVVTYLYRVVALAGTNASQASAIDFATTATTLFAEPIVAGSTIVRGSHVMELRNAIDAVRISAGLNAYGGWTGWPASYSPATGPILGADVGAMRTALDEALFALKVLHLPTTANPSGPILASDFNDLREGVR